MCDRCSEREGSTSAPLMRLSQPATWFLSAISLLLLLFPFLDLPVFKRPRCMFKSEKKKPSWVKFLQGLEISSMPLEASEAKKATKLWKSFHIYLHLYSAVDSPEPCAAHNQKSPSKIIIIIIITFCSHKYSQPAPNFNSITWIFVFKDAKSYFRHYIKHSKECVPVGERLAEPEGGVKQAISLESLRSHKRNKREAAFASIPSNPQPFQIHFSGSISVLQTARCFHDQHMVWIIFLCIFQQHRCCLQDTAAQRG